MSRVANANGSTPVHRNHASKKINSRGSRKVITGKRRDSRSPSYPRYSASATYNVETKQRAVFDWYENNRFDAGSIFSTEWKCRLTGWRQEFDGDISKQTLHDEIASKESNPEELQLGAFFLAHPVPAFSLWNLLQSCYKLDKFICGVLRENRTEVAKWQELRPFEYLLSEEIMSDWQRELASLSSEGRVNTNRFKQEAYFARLQAMFEGVQRLQETQSVVEQTFQSKRKDLPCSYWMLSMIQSSVDARCRVIKEVLQE